MHSRDANDVGRTKRTMYAQSVVLCVLVRPSLVKADGGTASANRSAAQLSSSAACAIMRLGSWPSVKAGPRLSSGVVPMLGDGTTIAAVPLDS
jgi:hypothetical protein